METILVLAIAIPICGSFFLPLIGALSTRLRNAMALSFVAASLAASAALVGPVLAGKAVNLRLPVSLPGLNFLKGFDFVLKADALGIFMALAASLVSSLIVIYSFGYLKHDEDQNEYYLMVVLFLGAMIGLVYSQNLIYIYLFWEISALACWRLIGFYREPEYIIRADKAFLVTVGGALAMLMGFVILYSTYGSFEIQALQGKLAPNLAVLLIMIGIFSKSATLPFHTWLPDAGVAPSPVTALLHAAVLVKIGVFVFARIFVGGLMMAPIWDSVLPVVVAVSALVTGGAALIETDIKRIVAYSTVSQLAFIFLGLMMHNSLAITGGLLFILMHALGKGGLFLCAGIVEHNAHTKDIRQMGGLAKTMPVTAIAFGLCSLSLMGIPPFGGFFAKYMIIAGTVPGNPWVAAAFILGSFLTVLYLLRVFTLVFLGETKLTTLVKEGSASMLWAVAILAVLSLLGGFLIQYPTDFIQIALGQR